MLDNSRELDYDPEEALEHIGPYDLVPEPGKDSIYIIDTRLDGEIVDEVEEGIDNAIIAAQRQCNWDNLMKFW